MNFYEADIVAIREKLKEMEENPGKRLKCHRVYLEKMIEMRKKQIEGWRQGRPFLNTDSMASNLFFSMGFLPMDKAYAASPKEWVVAGDKHTFAYQEKARALGLPVDVMCEHTCNDVAVGDTDHFPDESLIYCTQRCCPMRTFPNLFLVHQLGKWQGGTFVFFDKPPDETEANLEYMVDQFREFIEIAEKKYPGVIKYDEDELIRLQEEQKVWIGYKEEIYEMIKHKPSPTAGADTFDSAGKWGFRNAEYVKTKRDELAERLEKGIAAVPGEKARVLWTGEQIRFFDPFEILTKWKVATVFWLNPGIAETHSAPIPRPAYYGGRKLTPLEEEAALVLQNMRAGRGAHWVDNVARVCRDLKIDAVIMGLQIGANCYVSLKGMMAERLQKELGIPTLQLEMSRWNPKVADEKTTTAQLNEFAQMLVK